MSTIAKFVLYHPDAITALERRLRRLTFSEQRTTFNNGGTVINLERDGTCVLRVIIPGHVTHEVHDALLDRVREVAREHATPATEHPS